MVDQSIFLENAYREAMNYADKAINKAKKIKVAYCENDVLYRGSMAKDSFIVLLCIALSIAGFFFERQLYDLLWKMILGNVNWGSLELLISIFYKLIIYLLLFYGVWTLFRIVHTKRLHGELQNFDHLALLVEENKKASKGKLQSIAKAMNEYSFVKLENIGSLEQKITDYELKAEQIGTSSRRAQTIVWGAVTIAIYIFYYLYVKPYMVKAIIEPFNYFGTLTVCISYLILLLLNYNIHNILWELMKKTANYFEAILFAIFQFTIFLDLKATEAFLPVVNTSEYNFASEKNIDYFFARFMDVFVKEGLIYLFISCLIGIMIFLSTDIDREREGKKKNSILVKRNGEKEEKIGMTALTIMLILMTFLGSFFMAGVLNKIISFLSVLTALAISYFWAMLKVEIQGPETTAVYGKRWRWIERAFYFSYIYLTLSRFTNDLGSKIFLVVVQIIVIFGFTEGVKAQQRRDNLLSQGSGGE